MNKLVVAIFSGFSAALAIGLLAYADSLQPQHLFLMAPFGASAVLVFGLPDSPLAQPKNVVLGHLLAAFVGLALAQLLGVHPLSIAIATGVAITGMLLTGTTHPPAGANPILIMLAGVDWDFLVFPVLLGTVTIVIFGALHKKLRSQLVIE
ncbi:HPP family protein [Corallincola platygyrae]|uniref:HPP family protein n=1 Tax=Corallincola platygyrae TaxID=1193278 RepID=A0ABW4XJ20_9GAMM